MKWYLNLNDRAFKAIKNRTKRVEIRANCNDEDYSKFNKNDIIVFKNSEEDTINCKITEINYYKTIEELLMLEGTKHTLSSTNDYNEGIISINSLKGYEKAIRYSGVYAIHIQYLYSDKDIWNELYNAAREKQNPRTVSKFIDAGGVSAALITESGNIYTGVCIDTSCSLGMCAERNAIANMITNGENNIVKLVCIGGEGKIIMPCGACMEYMMQLGENSENIEILQDLSDKKSIKLKELIPVWWGRNRNIQEVK